MYPMKPSGPGMMERADRARQKAWEKANPTEEELAARAERARLVAEYHDRRDASAAREAEEAAKPAKLLAARLRTLLGTEFAAIVHDLKKIPLSKFYEHAEAIMTADAREAREEAQRRFMADARETDAANRAALIEARQAQFAPESP